MTWGATIERAWRARIELVKTSSTYRVYGACLAATHLFTFLYWYRGFFLRVVTDEAPICWPFFEDCAVVHDIPEPTYHVVMWLYAAGAAAALAAFLRPTTGGVAP